MYFLGFHANQSTHHLHGSFLFQTGVLEQSSADVGNVQGSHVIVRQHRQGAVQQYYWGLRSSSKTDLPYIGQFLVRSFCLTRIQQRMKAFECYPTPHTNLILDGGTSGSFRTNTADSSNKWAKTELWLHYGKAASRERKNLLTERTIARFFFFP